MTSRDAGQQQPARRVVPTWATIWQAVQVGLYTGVCTFLAAEITNGVGIAFEGSGRAAINAGVAAMLGFLGWAAAGTVRQQDQAPK